MRKTLAETPWRIKMPRRDKTDELSSLEYRGGTIVKVPDNVQLYICIAKEIPLDMNYAEDHAALDSFSKQNCVIKPAEGNKHVVQIPVLKNYPLHEALNMRKQNEFPILTALGIESLLPEPGVGFLLAGRWGDDYYSIDRFRGKNKEGKDRFLETYPSFINEYLKVNPTEAAIFANAMKQVGLSQLPDPAHPEKIDAATIQKIAAAYAIYQKQMMQAIAPSIEKLKSDRNKIFPTNCLFDSTTSSIREGDSKNWPWVAQLGWYPLQRGNGLWLNVVDGISKNGLEAKLLGKTADQMLPLVEKEMQHDTNDPFRIKYGNGDVKQHVTDTKGGVLINMRRKTDSPIVHAPIMNLLDKTKQTTIINIGDIDPTTDRRENTLFMTNYPL